MESASSLFEKQPSASRKSTTVKSKIDWTQLQPDAVEVTPPKVHPLADVKRIVRGMLRQYQSQ
jgi:hypothetical protein